MTTTEVVIWTAIGAVIASVVGGVVAGIFALRGGREAMMHAQMQQDRQRKMVVRGVLQAIHDEIETVWDRYMNTAGAHMEALPTNTAFLFRFPVVTDYFTVYSGNAFLLGQLDDNDLRKAVVTTYTSARGLIDSFRLNNDLLQQYDYWHLLYRQTHDAVQLQNANSYLTLLVQYAGGLKTQHAKLKADVEDLLRRLRKRGVLNEAWS